MKFRAQQLWSLLPPLLAAWASSTLYGVLPQIMQDEYIYSTQARNAPFELHPYSNYFFSWVMSGTKACGVDFYSCTKAINTIVFVIGVLFTLLIAARYLSLGWTVFVASITALSPLVIQTSFFMPEAMYFTVMTMSIWVTLLASKKGTWWLWGLAGMSLGLAALVKPHAIFILPAVVIFAFVVELRRTEKVLKVAIPFGTSVATGFLISKLGLGFIFAGSAGLKFFGGYGSPVERISDLAADDSENAAEATTSAFEVLLSVASAHLVAHMAVIALLAGLPLLLSLRVTLRVLKTKEPIGEASSFLFLIALVTLSMLALVPTFEAYVTAEGDDHSLRLILRYYEFLIPNFLVSAFMLDRFVEPSKISRFIQATGVSALSVGFALVYPTLIDTKFADSSLLSGLEDSPAVFVGLAIVVSATSIYWAINPERGSFTLSRITLPLLLVVATFLSQDLLVRSSSMPAYFDFAGQAAGEVLKNAEGSEIIVVGQVRTEVFTAKFWIDKARIEDELIYGESIYDLAEAGENKYALVLGQVQVFGAYSVLSSGDGYQIIEILK